jgi:hypothetical protein
VLYVDSLIVAVAPKPPAKHLRGGDDDDDDDDDEEELVRSSHNISKNILFTSICAPQSSYTIICPFCRSSKCHKQQHGGRNEFSYFLETN